MILEKSNAILTMDRVNDENQQVYQEMINLIGIEGSMINLLFSIKKYVDHLTPLEFQYYKHVSLAHNRKDNSITIEDVNELYKIVDRVRSSL